MRIAQASMHAYRLPYRRQVAWSDTAETSADYLLLRLADDEGRVGLAEVTLKRTWNGGSPRAVTAAVEDLFLPMLRQQVPTTREALLAMLDAVPENGPARCLVGTALAMLLDAANVTADDAPPIEVPLSWAVTRNPPAAMAAEAVDMVARHGFRTLKVKGGQGLETDLRAVRAIRNAVGEGVLLTVDANGAYPPEESLAYAARLADAGVAVVEDPAPLMADAVFDELMRRAPLPVLVDFPCASDWHAQALLHAGCHALSVKPGRYGVPEARRIAARAEAAGARCCIGLFGESALGTLINLQLAREGPALTSFLPAELTFYLTLQEQVLPELPTIRDGCLRLPPASTLAAGVDAAQLRRYAIG